MTVCRWRCRPAGSRGPSGRRVCPPPSPTASRCPPSSSPNPPPSLGASTPRCPCHPQVRPPLTPIPWEGFGGISQSPPPHSPLPPTPQWPPVAPCSRCPTARGSCRSPAPRRPQPPRRSPPHRMATPSLPTTVSTGGTPHPGGGPAWGQNPPPPQPCSLLPQVHRRAGPAQPSTHRAWGGRSPPPHRSPAAGATRSPRSTTPTTTVGLVGGTGCVWGGSSTRSQPLRCADPISAPSPGPPHHSSGPYQQPVSTHPGKCPPP